MMSKALPFAITVVIVVVGVLFFQNKTSVESTDNIEQKVNLCKEVVGKAQMIMKEEGYDPQDITVKRCTKVVFKNRSSTVLWPASNLHPTHGIYPEFDPQQGINPGQEWSFVFDKVGNWRYHDHLFPAVRGTVTVTE